MKKPVAILAVILALGAGIYYWTRPKPAVAPNGSWEKPLIVPLISAGHIAYYGQDDKNAFELLLENANENVQYKQYDYGVFIESIRGVKPESNQFWKLYINGQESPVGADKLQTKAGDIIEWKLEEIKP